MADIQRYLFLRHLRGTPTMHVRQHRRGKLVRDGVGLSFWFRRLIAVISEIPIDDRELPLLFHARTSDFQDVSVQATVTYRITDPAAAATRLDFSIDPDSGAWRVAPLDQIASLLSELAQQYAYELLAASSLNTALTAGPGAVRERIDHQLATDPRLRVTGLEVVAVRVVAVRAEPDMEKALQTPAREHVQQDADRATYERRAVAVERERAIAENELQNQIELAIREEHLVAQRGQNDRRRAGETAAAGRIEAQAAAKRDQLLAAGRAGSTRLVGQAEADAEAAKLDAYRDVDSRVLFGLVLRDLAGSLPSMGPIAITPDLLTGVLAKLVGAPAVGAGSAIAEPGPDRAGTNVPS